MRQTKRFHTANLVAATTVQIAQFDKSGAKIRILNITGGNGSFTIFRVTVRDSSRSYDFICGISSSIDIPSWIDSKGQLRSAIELEGNVIFEITNDAAAGQTPAACAILYDINYDRQES
jgi:hypothetical protein